MYKAGGWVTSGPNALAGCFRHKPWGAQWWQGRVTAIEALEAVLSSGRPHGVQGQVFVRLTARVMPRPAHYTYVVLTEPTAANDQHHTDSARLAFAPPYRSLEEAAKWAGERALRRHK
jgi:hypothetical protein